MFMYESFASGQKIITNLYRLGEICPLGRLYMMRFFSAVFKLSNHCRTKSKCNEIKDPLENLSSFSLLLFSGVMHTFLPIKKVIMSLIRKNQPPWFLFPVTAIKLQY